jgi:anti-sigma factor ChrR (cupin superfamily)
LSAAAIWALESPPWRLTTAENARTGRRVLNVDETPFLPYDLEGPVQTDMSWLPVSYDGATGEGCYVMRMDPGAVTLAHDHSGMEEFLVLEGDLVDDDRAVFRAGDFVSYDAGTRHNSWTETGCVIAVFEWHRSSRLESG